METNGENIFDGASNKLFQDLKNEEVKEFLVNNYQGKSFGQEREEEVYRYIVNNSVFFASMAAQHGSSVITEFLYEGIEPRSVFDEYALSSKAGRAIKARLLAMEKELPKIIDEYRAKGNVLIANLGSGPGRDMIDVLAEKYKDASDIKVVSIDKDMTALRRGKRMAEIRKVGHLIDFVQASFTRYEPKEKFDILILVGVLCPLKTEVCIELLRTVRNLLKPGGCLIASNVAKPMLQEDPFACYIMNFVADWKFVYKDENELKSIFEKSGFNWKRSFSDEFGFHIMGIGTV
jgi:SAM-dependent methyltransferase